LPPAPNAPLRHELVVVPLKDISPCVAKYDVRLRENALWATHAQQTTLSRLVLFECKVCSESFQTFHPAYDPSDLAPLHLLKRGAAGVAPCNIEVHMWDEVPALEVPEQNLLVAERASGTCRRCQVDMDEQRDALPEGAEETAIVPKRSHLNLMDPCHGLPRRHDLLELFRQATEIEAMLVALEHMQVSYVTCSRTRLNKFRRNTISFPQDLAGFLARTGLSGKYRVGDRVNSVRGPGHDLARAPMMARDAPPGLLQQCATNAAGQLTFGATITGERQDGAYELRYDVAADATGVELVEHLTPRVQMPWHPKDLRGQLVIMLRRNMGHGQLLEGLEVRWGLVHRLLQVLSQPGWWRPGQTHPEPMHKWYDTRVLDVLSEEEMRARFAPADSSGPAKDARTGDDLSAQGFDVRSWFTEAEAAGGGEHPDSVGETSPLGDARVDEDEFADWLFLGTQGRAELPLGYQVARWWSMQGVDEEFAGQPLKLSEEETSADLYQHVQDARRRAAAAEEGQAPGRGRAVDVTVGFLVRWLKERVGEAFAVDGEQDDGGLIEELSEELAVVNEHHAPTEHAGCMDSAPQGEDVEETAQAMARSLAYGWPTVDREPEGFRSPGRFAKCFPLQFPMGEGDPFDWRPRETGFAECVQHLFRHSTGIAVHGEHGHRLIWALVNVLLLLESSGKGFAVHRVAMRRLRGRVEGFEVLTRRQLRDIIESEDAARSLVYQLQSVGRDVRSTPMSWSYERKKADCCVKHLGWRPPWVKASEGSDPDPAAAYLVDEKFAVEDLVGLGRIPVIWWTLNPKYNALYDVQRLNADLRRARAATEDGAAREKQARFDFGRDRPDLVAYQVALRAELTMRMVMPAVIPHTPAEPILSMARPEVGSGGNPHTHGFTYGARNPRLLRVKADTVEGGEGDNVEDSVADSGAEAIDQDLWGDDSLAAVPTEEAYAAAMPRVLEAVREHTGEAEVLARLAATTELNADEAALVLKRTLREGIVLRDEADGESPACLRVPPPPPPLPYALPLPAGRRDLRPRPSAEQDASIGPRAQLEAPCLKPENLCSKHRQVQSQSEMERVFAEYFGGILSEWNPTFTEDGEPRFVWDDSVQAHDVQVESLPPGVAEVLGVNQGEPERTSLKGILDRALAGAEAGGSVDLTELRQLLGALVRTSERHTIHASQAAPVLGKHPCARKVGTCVLCRYGFPHRRCPRGGRRPMRLERGDRPGQWHARFPRNDALCCSYEPHVLLSNMGNIDWRPCLNLWAVVEYVSKYATKAPTGCRRVADVLEDAVGEVLRYTPEGSGRDLLRASLQKVYTRTLGDRDYSLYETVQIGLNLPQVTPLLEVVSLNANGPRRLKTGPELSHEGEDAVLTWDSKVDKFNKRLALVHKQYPRPRQQAEREELLKELRDMSMYEFYCKYYVSRGRICRSRKPVAIMVTPSMSADAANVDDGRHSNYARCCVVAYWRMMPTKERHEMAERCMREGKVEPVDRRLWGETELTAPSVHGGAPHLDRFLGVRDLYSAIKDDDGWCLALMEMLTDPVLACWVPGWVVEQYERQNPYFRHYVEKVLKEDRSKEGLRNHEVLRRVRRRMQRRLTRVSEVRASRGMVGDVAEDDGLDDGSSSESERDEPPDDADPIAAPEPGQGRHEIDREVGPEDVDLGDAGDEAEERGLAAQLSAAGPAPAAPDLVVRTSEGAAGDIAGQVNPANYEWPSALVLTAAEKTRLQGLWQQWGDKDVDGECDACERDDLDAWQKFAWDIANKKAEERDGRRGHLEGYQPLRLLITGTAGAGKSRLIRSIVKQRRRQAGRPHCVQDDGRKDDGKHACLLAAPTGCASFQMKFGACTIHRAFSIGCGVFKRIKDQRTERCIKVKKRLKTARCVILDELSMIGRAMHGKILVRCEEFLPEVRTSDRKEVITLGAKDLIEAGDYKQIEPIGDTSMTVEGPARTKDGCDGRGKDGVGIPTSRLVARALALRDEFQDVVLLRNVHRRDDGDAKTMAPDVLKKYQDEADRYQRVMLGLVDCTWRPEDHAWLASRCRSRLAATEAGRQELKNFEHAPLLMDSKKRLNTGEDGADQQNAVEIRRLACKTGQPIARLRAQHGGQEVERPERLGDEEFQGVRSYLELCVGARVILTKNLWVPVGLMNGALGHVRGFVWLPGGSPTADRPELRTPLYVVVEFDDVLLGAADQESFFPDQPDKRRWVPIQRHEVHATTLAGVTRKHFPLSLAYALTHWKAQGMNLKYVRVALGTRIAAVAGVAFTAMTRVGHFRRLLIEGDLPAWEVFQRACQSVTFRNRRRFELKLEARASMTLRKHGFCEEDVWTEEEKTIAEQLLKVLRTRAREQLQTVRDDPRVPKGRASDDAHIWPDGEPTVAGELSAAGTELIGAGMYSQAQVLPIEARLCGPLHVAASRQALGCLIPPELSPDLDTMQSRKRQKAAVAAPGGVQMRAGAWRVSVFEEQCFAQGSAVSKEVLEFFLTVLRHASAQLGVAVAIGSQALGARIGSDTPVPEVCNTVKGWKSWRPDEVSGSTGFIAPVRASAQAHDWVLALVESEEGPRVPLGAQGRLHVIVVDPVGRASVGDRIGECLTRLIRGWEAERWSDACRVTMAATPCVPEASDRCLAVLGRAFYEVGYAPRGSEQCLLSGPRPDDQADGYAEALRQGARAVFAHLRTAADRTPGRDVLHALASSVACEHLVKLFARPGVERHAASGTPTPSAGRPPAVLRPPPEDARLLRVLTWNIASAGSPGKSEASPKFWTKADNLQTIQAELLRWDADLLSLQECPRGETLPELRRCYDLVGAADAHAGEVRLYAKKGISIQRTDARAAPLVSADFTHAGLSARVIAAHLAPSAAGAKERLDAVASAVNSAGAGAADAFILVGDLNVGSDEECQAWCRTHHLHDAVYASKSWCPKYNRYYRKSDYNGPGINFDRFLWRGAAWATSVLVGKGRIWSEGVDFCLSDHYAVLTHVDVHESHRKVALRHEADTRKGRLGQARDADFMAEAALVRERDRVGRASAALELQRAAARERQTYQKEAQAQAKRVKAERARLVEASFGQGTLFARVEDMAVGRWGQRPPRCADVPIPGVPRSSCSGYDAAWAGGVEAGAPALAGLYRPEQTCYAVSTCQVLLRVPCVAVWLRGHRAGRHAAGEHYCAGGRCCACWLESVRLGLRAGLRLPSPLEGRAIAGAAFSDGEQHDAAEFLEALLNAAREREIEHGRWANAPFAHEGGAFSVTQPDRIFRHIIEERHRCKACEKYHGTFDSGVIWRLSLPAEAQASRSGGGRPVPVTELYIRSCAPEEIEWTCPMCNVRTQAARQQRLVSLGNAVIFQIPRVRDEALPKLQTPVLAEEQVNLPGHGSMVLWAVVYHRGSPTSGHYTCASRGPGGRFWTFDDHYEPRHLVDIARHTPSKVVLLVYCRPGGASQYAEAPEGGPEGGAGRAEPPAPPLPPGADPEGAVVDLTSQASCAGKDDHGLPTGESSADAAASGATPSSAPPAARVVPPAPSPTKSSEPAHPAGRGASAPGQGRADGGLGSGSGGPRPQRRRLRSHAAGEAARRSELAGAGPPASSSSCGGGHGASAVDDIAPSDAGGVSANAAAGCGEHALASGSPLLEFQVNVAGFSVAEQFKLREANLRRDEACEELIMEQEPANGDVTTAETAAAGSERSSCQRPASASGACSLGLARTPDVEAAPMSPGDLAAAASFGLGQQRAADVAGRGRGRSQQARGRRARR